MYADWRYSVRAYLMPKNAIQKNNDHYFVGLLMG